MTVRAADDKTEQMLVRESNGRADAGVQDAGDGAEAVSLASRERPDLVLMDVRMPVMDGVEATRRILEARPDTAVIIVSSFADLDPATIGARAKIDKSEFNHRRVLEALGI